MCEAVPLAAPVLNLFLCQFNVSDLDNAFNALKLTLHLVNSLTEARFLLFSHSFLPEMVKMISSREMMIRMNTCFTEA